MKKIESTNEIIESDFLKYLEDTFFRWSKLYEKEVTLGTREISKFEQVLKGAKLNSRVDFCVVSHREWNEKTKQNHYTVLIYKNKEEMKTEPPLYTFDTPIFG